MLLLASRDLLRRYGALPWSLTRTRVGMRALSANRQVAPVPQSAIRLNFNQPPDVHLRLFAQIAFDAAFGLDCGAQTRRFILGQVLNLLGVVHVGFRGQRLRARLPDAVNRSEPNPKPLFRRQVHTCDASHSLSSGLWPNLSLALAVLGVRTNHAHHAAPMNDLALHADFLYRCPNLHFSTPSPLGGPLFLSLRAAAALFVAVHDSAARQIVGRKLHRHAIP